MTSNARVAVIYYSATGTAYLMALAALRELEQSGAEVRLRKVHELAPEEAIRANEGWSSHVRATQDIPEASTDDLEWADGVLFGTPTRYGNMTAQLEQFIDTTGPLWEAGKLADKVYGGFCSTATPHGGQESTLLAMFRTFHHCGGIVVTPAYLEPFQFEAGNPYGASHTSNNGEVPPDDLALEATRLTARRVLTVANALKDKADLLAA